MAGQCELPLHHAKVALGHFVNCALNQGLLEAVTSFAPEDPLNLRSFGVGKDHAELFHVAIVFLPGLDGLFGLEFGLDLPGLHIAVQRGDRDEVAAAVERVFEQAAFHALVERLTHLVHPLVVGLMCQIACSKLTHGVFGRLRGAGGECVVSTGVQCLRLLVVALVLGCLVVGSVG